MNALGPWHLYDSVAEGWPEDIVVIAFACGLEMVVTEGGAVVGWDGHDKSIDYPVGEA